MNTSFDGLREVSAQGLTKIGGGISGSVYALNDEQILKVYADSVTYEEVSHLFDVSVFLDKNGIKTAKAYEIVNADGVYGIIQQYIDGEALPKLIANGAISRQEAAQRMGELLNRLHDIEPDHKILPTLDTMFGGLLDRCGDRLNKLEKKRMAQSIGRLSCGEVILHGDFHENNIMVKDNEFYLIDLDSVCIGSPLFEFLQIFCVYQNDIPVEMQEALHLGPEDVTAFLRKMLEVYFHTTDNSIIDKWVDIFSHMGNFNRFLAHFLMARGDEDGQLRRYATENLEKVTRELEAAAEACSGLEYRWK